MKKFPLLLLLILVFGQLLAQEGRGTVKQLKITILSTMLSQKGIGEWGFSALIEADSTRILFDAGGREKTVLENCKELNIDLSNVPTLILSHNHGDHTVGWLPLRNAMKKVHPNALSITHVGKGLFDTRISASGEENRSRQNDSLLYVQTGGQVRVHNEFVEIYPGIFLTGPVPRKYPEKNYGLGGNIIRKKDAAGNIIEDIVPEDMSLVIRTGKGLVVVSGCGHSGIINTVDYVQNNLPQQPVLAAIGGFHLLENSDEQIKWTAGQLKQSGLRYFMGAHCTGIEPVYQIREWVGLKRGECIVGSVGSFFDLDKGFVAGPLTK
ncbi:MAG TPA: MBL fold metallo-hydrolase [Chitinophagaceae bacterium]|nr:MBL fold metallo-hydrolase [Chitinophagaceae bacterium]